MGLHWRLHCTRRTRNKNRRQRGHDPGGKAAIVRGGGGGSHYGLHMMSCFNFQFTINQATTKGCELANQTLSFMVLTSWPRFETDRTMHFCALILPVK